MPEETFNTARSCDKLKVRCQGQVTEATQLSQSSAQSHVNICEFRYRSLTSDIQNCIAVKIAAVEFSDLSKVVLSSRL